jgi:hypothetical protein
MYIDLIGLKNLGYVVTIIGNGIIIESPESVGSPHIDKYYDEMKLTPKERVIVSYDIAQIEARTHLLRCVS